jgi:uncharacterized protein YbjQ (UPF0145 family)
VIRDRYHYLIGYHQPVTGTPRPRLVRSTPTSSDVLLATTETVAGARVVRTLGYVEGSGMLQLTESAQALGANAVLGLRWAMTEEVEGVGPESFAYGTAVVIETEAG